MGEGPNGPGRGVYRALFWGWAEVIPLAGMEGRIDHFLKRKKDPAPRQGPHTQSRSLAAVPDGLNHQGEQRLQDRMMRRRIKRPSQPNVRFARIEL